MSNSVKTPFTQAIISAPSFVIKPTLGDTPTGAINSGDANVSGTVRPIDLPLNTLMFGGKK